MVPESLMPHYAFLAETPLETGDVQQRMRTLRLLGVPYTDEEIANANADLMTQADPSADSTKLVARYPKANVVPGDSHQPTEADALVAYLQMLGTLVNFADTNTERLQQ
jgi:cytochrome c oxidase cbb3-type subunit II